MHSYDILANPLYRQQFQYVAADEPDRAALIIDGDFDESNDEVQSDMVKVALNLAFAHGKDFKETMDQLKAGKTYAINDEEQ